jgi:acyl-CoA synthetase (AMP-forming)/AMP-acid ligase II/NADP-dependent 3-hydroxy acid dehydrogenase YdfG
MGHSTISPLPIECVEALERRLSRLPRVREVYLLFSRATSPSSHAGTVKVVLACDAPPAPEEVEHIARETLPDGWRITVSSTPALPLRPDGGVDEEALARLPGLDSESPALAERLISALPEVRDCAAVLVREIAPAPCIHLDHAVPGWRGAPAATLEANGQGVDRPGSVAAAGQPEARSMAAPALAEGPELPELSLDDLDLARILERAVHEHPARFVLVAPGGGETVLTTTEVWDKAGCLAGHLADIARPAGFVILLTDDALQTAAGFWACLRAGLTAAPLAPPRGDARDTTDGGLAKLRNIWELLEHPPVAASSACVADLTRAFGPAMRVIDLDRALADHDSSAPEPPSMLDPDAPAVITFTSGTTGLPKGVPISFRNLRSMHHAMDATLELSRADVAFNWLPMDHLGPLNFFSLMPALRGSDQVHAPTEMIMKSPLRLLDLFHRWRCTNTWAPNFAFNLINAQTEELARAVAEKRWDLSCVRVLINAGEAVAEGSTLLFCRNLAPCGLSPDAVWPAFGMTESTTGITFSQGLNMAESADPCVMGSFADLGPPVPGSRVRIADDRGRVLPEDRVGLLQITGPQVTRGYFRNPVANAEAFTPDGWLITGDLAFLRNKRLFLTGRAKEVVIINGLNYNCHELEAAVESVPGVAPNKSAAVAARPGHSSTEELTVFFHPAGMEANAGADPPWPAEDGPHLAAMMRRIKETLAARLAVTPARCLPVGGKAIPRTATGKVQRLHLAGELASGVHDRLVRAVDVLEQNSSTLPPWLHEVVWRPRLLDEPRRAPGQEQTWLLLHAGQPLARELAARLASGPARVVLAEPGERLRRLGTGRYELPPGEADAFARFMDLLDKEGAAPDHIVDARCLGPVGDTPDAGCVLPLASALVRRVRAGRGVPGLIVLADRAVAVLAGDEVDPRRSMLPALAAAASKETGVDCTFVDVSPAGVEAELLLRELLQPSGEPEVAWRADRRLVRRLRPLAFPPSAPNAVDLRWFGGLWGRLSSLPIRGRQAGKPAPHTLKSTALPSAWEATDTPAMPEMLPGQACMVTGGLGGVGALLCSHLLERFQARIIALGRGDLNGDPAGRELLAGLQALAREGGGEMRYLAVDVADPAALERILAAPPSGWESARAFHLAGRERIAGLEAEDLNGLAAQWRVKAGAAEVLLRWAEAGSGRGVCVFSSVNGMFPTVGSAAYAAANRAMEEMVAAAAARGVPAQCAAWSSWAGTGMSRRQGREEALRANGLYVLDPRRALLSLDAVLPRAGRFLVGLDQARPPAARLLERNPASPLSMTGLAVYCESAALPSNIMKSLRENRSTSTHDDILRAIKPIVVDKLPRDSEGRVDRDVLADLARGRSGRAAPPRTRLEALLLDRMRKELELPETGVDENFFALGGHSLTAARFLSRLQGLLGVEVPLQDFFRNPTAAGLAETMLRNEPIPGRLETMARLRLEVESLSPEELQARLRAMQQSSGNMEHLAHE